MAITAPGKPVPPEKPDVDAARGGGKGENRPGFDLGGADAQPNQTAADDSTAPLRNPQQSPGSATSGAGGTTGMTQGGDRALGGPAGGTKPGEALGGAAGAVRPPQTTSADRSFAQGNPDDAT